MTAHNTPQEALLQELSVTAEAGLSSQEAQRRLAEYGENKLAEKKKKTNRDKSKMRTTPTTELIVVATITIQAATIQLQTATTTIRITPTATTLVGQL